MKTILLSLFVSLSAFAGVVSPGASIVPNVTVAGVTIPLSRAIILHAKAGATNYDTFRRNGAFYQVPTGKKLIVVAIRAFNDGTAANTCARIGSSTATVANGASPTGYAVLDIGGLDDGFFTNATNYEVREAAIYAEFTAGQYINLNPTLAAAATLLGYEQ